MIARRAADFLQDVAELDMAALGRLMQIAALVLLPVSMIMQLQKAITSGQMLMMLVAGGSMFYIGRIVEGYARR